MKGKGNGKIDTVHELYPSTSALAGYGAGMGLLRNMVNWCIIFMIFMVHFESAYIKMFLGLLLQG